MLSDEDNQLLTRVGPGTPCGELLRRYWHPIAGARELTEEQPKKRIKILGEELVLFRDQKGGYGLIGEHCSHRGTSLYYGFLEGGGIRCITSRFTELVSSTDEAESLGTFRRSTLGVSAEDVSLEPLSPGGSGNKSDNLASLSVLMI